VILGLTYEHDAVGNPTGMLESGGDRVTWTYDATDRLTREQRSGPSAYDTTYTYDPLGNRLVKDASGALTTSTYDLANQLVTSQDANGHDDVHVRSGREPAHRRAAHRPADDDHLGRPEPPDRRASARRQRGHQHLPLRRTALQQTRAASHDKIPLGRQQLPGRNRRRDEIQAVYTNEPQPYGNLISQYRKGPTLWLPSYYHYDALGSTRVLTDDAGDVSDTYVYDAWGNELAFSGSTINPLRWVGQVGYYWDESHGRFYIRARVYEPVTVGGCRRIR
jgi:YD repeat-containing protein